MSRTKQHNRNISAGVKRAFAEGRFRPGRPWAGKTYDSAMLASIVAGMKRAFAAKPKHRRNAAEYAAMKCRVKGQLYKKALIAEGLKKDVCEDCGQLPVWNGKELVLQIDHIDGDSANNKFENIKVCCPNCHSQTETWSGKNIGRIAASSNGKTPDSGSGNVGSNPAAASN